MPGAKPPEVPYLVWCNVIKDLAKDADAAVIAAHLGKEILKRAPKFFHRRKIYLFQHCFDRLEYVFPEINWKDVSVEELREAMAHAVHEARVADTCPHPDEHVECIAQLEYPGGSISWCKRCGAWKDDELCEWVLPDNAK